MWKKFLLSFSLTTDFKRNLKMLFWLHFYDSNLNLWFENNTQNMIGEPYSILIPQRWGDPSGEFCLNSCLASQQTREEVSAWSIPNSTSDTKRLLNTLHWESSHRVSGAYSFFQGAAFGRVGLKLGESLFRKKYVYFKWKYFFSST